MTDTATLPSTASPAAESGVAVPGALAPGTGSRRGARRPRRTWGRMRQVSAWVLLAFAVILLWPAQLGGITALTVVNGHSMEPTYETGDLVVSVKLPRYRVGDVVSFAVPEGQDGAGGRVIHRIVDVRTTAGGRTYTTQGDHNPQPDPWRIGDADILGRAFAHVPRVGVGLTPQGAPIVLAIALGGIVTLLLWGDGRGSRSRTREPHDDHP